MIAVSRIPTPLATSIAPERPALVRCRPATNGNIQRGMLADRQYIAMFEPDNIAQCVDARLQGGIQRYGSFSGCEVPNRR